MNLIHVSGRRRVAAAVAVGVAAAGVAAAAATVAAAGPTEVSSRVGVFGAADAGIGIGGVHVNLVKFNGKLMTLPEFTRREAALNSAGIETYTNVGPRNARLGYIQATTDLQQEIRWTGHDPHVAPPEIPAEDASAPTAPAGAATPVSCTYSHGVNNSVFWTKVLCGDNYELIPLSGTRNTVIYNDSYGALELSCRESGIYVYKNSNLSGGYKYFHGNYQYTDLGAFTYTTGGSVNDSISSYESYYSGLTSC